MATVFIMASSNQKVGQGTECTTLKCTLLSVRMLRGLKHSDGFTMLMLRSLDQGDMIPEAPSLVVSGEIANEHRHRGDTLLKNFRTLITRFLV